MTPLWKKHMLGSFSQFRSTQKKRGYRRKEFGRKFLIFLISKSCIKRRWVLVTRHKDITKWSTLKSDWYILYSQRWRSSIQSGKTRPGADCGSDHELLIAKFRLKLKGGKNTRQFRYDLNQIPYDYTEEVRNRFKGLVLIDRVPDELWSEVRDSDQDHPQEKEMQKSKMAVRGGLTNSCEKKRSKKQRRKGKT